MKKLSNKANTGNYTIKFLSKSAYESIFDSLASIADMSYFNTDENWNVIE